VDVEKFEQVTEVFPPGAQTTGLLPNYLSKLDVLATDLSKFQKISRILLSLPSFKQRSVPCDPVPPASREVLRLTVGRIRRFKEPLLHSHGVNLPVDRSENNPATGTSKPA
jgi:hypothetical protein